MSEKKLAANEGIKTRSNYLRGTIQEGLADLSTGAMCEDDQQLLKFHGTYQQDDRDLRPNRRKHKLDKAYSFMIRVRVPGGVASPAQWLQMDEISTQFANGTIKLTTRQAFQFHGVIKTNLKRTMQEINQAAMDTIAACGDVNRNVMCSPNPFLSAAHTQAMEDARAISAHLTPQTRAYHEIWLDGEKVESSEEEVEPIYGKTYLPRKFKITVVVPPSNDVDIYADCLGFIAIVEDDKIIGYNVTVGGGMGATHGNDLTFPRTADVIGFCKADQIVDVAEKVVLVQRDFGDREVRAHARFKYTVDDHGPEGILKKLNEYLGYDLEPVRDFKFEDNGDRYGWATDPSGNSHYTMFVEGGRVLDTADYQLRTGLREIAKIHDGDFRLTGNQNLIIANISAVNRPAVEKLLDGYGISKSHLRSGLRLNNLACVALPTCALSLAEAERFLPVLLTELEESIEAHGLRHDAITIRMTGCPNGCARPYIAELGFVGKGPGRYNVLLGGGFHGQRLSKLFRSDVPAEKIKDLLDPVFASYAKEREEGERFGDFCIRSGLVAQTTNGADFHANLKPEALA
ncbi:MAG: NADPH-dependent assimilatory sulfite reductase hemoprotein subunit [Akkermansiaceae bacterium]|jgi:sulfite reductase (NADPH) hemoprotein beta-component|nr:NADPH-dependent assimilatory sulfite reductase hemoprotein subunit [Akkermansiaceae bacterium]MDP4722071.1 NADPH-dependent assimilatory sulfite reductase hemoprotein subunit [Akkermansiaceae bacterium]MDP4781433.1 NADPH-dependent assimilatory sulfite reductase hemoprotein subunit [Akkermansiaceae bacterium]MDP4848066.1 NADPH-dependent assimilatory sulfite reductase hemoprotein subunit [Akkermansiaceae bacterium]MDP4899083.1 NADPH-dependent assimilatory sulfite reductase hemoprotein subunit [